MSDHQFTVDSVQSALSIIHNDMSTTEQRSQANQYITSFQSNHSAWHMLLNELLSIDCSVAVKYSILCIIQYKIVHHIIELASDTIHQLYNILYQQITHYNYINQQYLLNKLFQCLCEIAVSTVSISIVLQQIESLYHNLPDQSIELLSCLSSTIQSHSQQPHISDIQQQHIDTLSQQISAQPQQIAQIVVMYLKNAMRSGNIQSTIRCVRCIFEYVSFNLTVGIAYRCGLFSTIIQLLVHSTTHHEVTDLLESICALLCQWLATKSYPIEQSRCDAVNQLISTVSQFANNSTVLHLFTSSRDDILISLCQLNSFIIEHETERIVSVDNCDVNNIIQLQLRYTCSTIRVSIISLDAYIAINDVEMDARHPYTQHTLYDQLKDILIQRSSRIESDIDDYDDIIQYRDNIIDVYDTCCTALQYDYFNKLITQINELLDQSTTNWAILESHINAMLAPSTDNRKYITQSNALQLIKRLLHYQSIPSTLQVSIFRLMRLVTYESNIDVLYNGLLMILQYDSDQRYHTFHSLLTDNITVLALHSNHFNKLLQYIVSHNLYNNQHLIQAVIEVIECVQPVQQAIQMWQSFATPIIEITLPNDSAESGKQQLAFKLNLISLLCVSLCDVDNNINCSDMLMTFVCPHIQQLVNIHGSIGDDVTLAVCTLLNNLFINISESLMQQIVLIVKIDELILDLYRRSTTTFCVATMQILISLISDTDMKEQVSISLHSMHHITLFTVNNNVVDHEEILMTYFDLLHTAIAIDAGNTHSAAQLISSDEMLSQVLDIALDSIKQTTSSKTMNSVISLIDTMLTTKLTNTNFKQTIISLIAQSGNEIMYSLLYASINTTIDRRYRATQSIASLIQTTLTAKRSAAHAALWLDNALQRTLSMVPDQSLRLTFLQQIYAERADLQAICTSLNMLSQLMWNRHRSTK